MSKNILFTETQRFRQWWLMLIIIGINLVAIWGFVQQVILGHTFGDKPTSNAGIIAFLIFTIVISIFLLSITLKTEITDEGVSIQFFPFINKPQSIPWNSLSDYKLIQYNALKEYGGWGLRFKSSGKAYNIAGNHGLLLEFPNGKTLLIGTQKPEELLVALKKLEDKSNNNVNLT